MSATWDKSKGQGKLFGGVYLRGIAFMVAKEEIRAGQSAVEKKEQV